MLLENEGRNVDDAIHELHVLYMRYFSLDDPWQPIPNRTNERTELLRQMAIAVDEILNAEERPNWLHPAMFHGPLTSAICSLPPIPDSNAILMPPTIDPREVYWSKFSICNHSRSLERKPFIVSLQYHSPYPLETSQTIHKLSPSKSGITTEISTTTPVNNNLTSFIKKSTLPRVGALSNNKFRNEQQIQIEKFVGEILQARGLQFNRSNDENKPKEYLYQLPSTNNPIYQ
ncbi:unnamed protein product [Cercopithifilaria johnstoni]|uniref:Uncharacterized protein n=1 Tax=Cercopithifilaria johnstoni TaxID=2874296 RepID=A0A8J2MU98_9BILA|nr:unnamed protein product [Cercopithifilaria johnstoni]